jgi:hypothetical protein
MHCLIIGAKPMSSPPEGHSDEVRGWVGRRGELGMVLARGCEELGGLGAGAGHQRRRGHGRSLCVQDVVGREGPGLGAARRRGLSANAGGVGEPLARRVRVTGGEPAQRWTEGICLRGTGEREQTCRRKRRRDKHPDPSATPSHRPEGRPALCSRVGNVSRLRTSTRLVVRMSRTSIVRALGSSARLRGRTEGTWRARNLDAKTERPSR